MSPAKGSFNLSRGRDPQIENLSFGTRKTITKKTMLCQPRVFTGSYRSLTQRRSIHRVAGGGYAFRRPTGSGVGSVLIRSGIPHAGEAKRRDDPHGENEEAGRKQGTCTILSLSNPWEPGEVITNAKEVSLPARSGARSLTLKLKLSEPAILWE